MKTKKLILCLTLNGNTIERDVVSIDSLVGSLGLLNDGDSFTVYCKEIEVSGQK